MKQSRNRVLKIRRAKYTDAEAMLLIQYRAVHISAATHYTREALNNWASQITDEQIMELEDELNDSDHDSVLLVATIDKKVVGWAEMLPKDNYVAALFVDPKHAGKGIGTRLLSELERLARECALEYIYLWSAFNAVKFYQRCGMVLPEGFEMPTGKSDKWETVKLTKELKPFPYVAGESLEPVPMDYKHAQPLPDVTGADVLMFNGYQGAVFRVPRDLEVDVLRGAKFDSAPGLLRLVGKPESEAVVRFAGSQEVRRQGRGARSLTRIIDDVDVIVRFVIEKMPPYPVLPLSEPNSQVTVTLADSSSPTKFCLPMQSHLEGYFPKVAMDVNVETFDHRNTNWQIVNIPANETRRSGQLVGALVLDTAPRRYRPADEPLKHVTYLFVT